MNSSAQRVLVLGVAAVGVLTLVTVTTSGAPRAVSGCALGLALPWVLLGRAFARRWSVTSAGAYGLALGAVLAVWTLGSIALLAVGIGLDGGGSVLFALALCATSAYLALGTGD